MICYELVRLASGVILYQQADTDRVHMFYQVDDREPGCVTASGPIGPLSMAWLRGFIRGARMLAKVLGPDRMRWLTQLEFDRLGGKYTTTDVLTSPE